MNNVAVPAPSARCARAHRIAPAGLLALLATACPAPEDDTANGGDGGSQSVRGDGGSNTDGSQGNQAGIGRGRGTDASSGVGAVSCGYWATVRSGCSGDSSYRKTAYGKSCAEGIDLATCRANIPLDTDEDTGTCFRSESFDYWLFEGDCDDWDAYWNDEVDCLVDDQCSGYASGQATCENQQCTCDGEPCAGSVGVPTQSDAGIEAGANGEGGVVTVGGDDAGAQSPGEGGVTVGGDGGGPSTGGSSGGASGTTGSEPDGGVTTPGGGSSGGSSGGTSGTTAGGPGAGVTTPGGGTAG